MRSRRLADDVATSSYGALQPDFAFRASSLERTPERSRHCDCSYTNEMLNGAEFKADAELGTASEDCRLDRKPTCSRTAKTLSISGRCQKRCQSPDDIMPAMLSTCPVSSIQHETPHRKSKESWQKPYARAAKTCQAQETSNEGFGEDCGKTDSCDAVSQASRYNLRSATLNRVLS